MKYVIFLFTAIMPFSVLANRSKATCSNRELQRQDCKLEAGKFKLSLLSEAVTWSDGTWHSVEPLPLKGEGLKWEKVRFEILAGWPILQLWIWDKVEGETRVQSLRWYVQALGDRKIDLLQSGVVRRRRQKAVDSPTDPKVPPPDPEFIYDAWEIHHLKALKPGRLEFQLGRSKKILERDKHGV